uniref:Erythroferrone-like n=1 Tax=Kryptolebias marmoratus TaxID=37003 RepID=A0A3Q3A6P7_KRYMA
ECDRPSRVSTSFSRHLLQDVSVPRRSLQELQLFSMPSDPERSLQRGQTFNSSTGRYTAPLSGFYQFTASLLISGDKVQVRVRDSVRAAICIESLCLNRRSVESVTGAAAAGGTFTILLTGTLYLQQVGEYVSVFVDNATGSSISILRDSQFSGILLGV